MIELNIIQHVYSVTDEGEYILENIKEAPSYFPPDLFMQSVFSKYVEEDGTVREDCTTVHLPTGSVFVVKENIDLLLSMRQRADLGLYG